MQKKGSSPRPSRSPESVKPAKKLEARTSTSLVRLDQTLPPQLPLLPVSQATLFPGMVIPVILPEGKLVRTIEHVMGGPEYVGVVMVRDAGADVATGPTMTATGLAGGTAKASKEPKNQKAEPFYRYGVAAKVLKRINLPDNQVSVLLSGLQRFEIRSVVSDEPFIIGNVRYIPEDLVRDTEAEALLRSALTQFKALSKDNPLISEEVKVALVNIDGPAKLADFIASVFLRDVDAYQEFLGQGDVKQRLHQLLLILKKEAEVQSVQRHISDEINQKVAAGQREFYLQEQLKLIQRELGRGTDKTKVAERFLERLSGKTLSQEVKGRIDEEVEKLQTLSEQSSEYSVAINYLDWATSLPWGVTSDENFNLTQAKKVLDADHYGLKDPKDRILEFLAVKKLRNTHQGSILCLVGPPGTGKTSLGKSVAKALGRKFFRFSVGGMRDESEIKGHRRTYVGAMPGKILQGLKRVGSENPVFLIDEIDKMGTWSHSGDPASALLEVLDPEQNKEFLDHYLDMPVDLSKVLFITTANSLDSIPSPLLDRMETIGIHGYTDKEKFFIARKHLIPKTLASHGLTPEAVKITDTALHYLIHRYAREAGVRFLEKCLSRLFRKVAFRIATGKKQKVVIDGAAALERYLGIPPHRPEAGLGSAVGVATGLAWTQFGGEVLHVESRAVPGKGGFTLTGSLGEVMEESAHIALTYVRGKAAKLKVDKSFFDKHSIHLHVPAGATPKDGPSAGVTLASSLYSLLTGKPLGKIVAMTGELSLTGKILPVGGIKEKLLAAKRSGFKTVLLPKANLRDLKEIEAEVKEGLNLKLMDNMDQVLKFLFEK